MKIGTGTVRAVLESQGVLGIGRDQFPGIEAKGERGVPADTLRLHFDRDKGGVLDRDVELFDGRDQDIAAVGLATQDGREQPHHFLAPDRRAHVEPCPVACDPHVAVAAMRRIPLRDRRQASLAREPGHVGERQAGEIGWGLHRHQGTARAGGGRLQRHNPDRLVPAAYGISGLYNLKPLTETSINTALGLDMAAAERESPLFWPAPSRLTMDAVVGGAESDEYHKQSRRLVDVWGLEGVQTRYEEIEGANHFTVIAGLADPENPMTRRIAALAGA